MNICRDSK